MGRKIPYTFITKRNKNKKSFLNRLILHELCDIGLQAIAPRLILEKALRPVEERGTLQTVRKIKTSLAQICGYGLANGVMERDYTLDLKGASMPPQATHPRDYY
ncbi:MAG: hypothetical protein LBR53_09210 [Deltaproteobacteria bacterium]|jgi:hypothetical protein|nr:hypothetical protein [Deltaproteobacteria bacterium]